MTELRLSVPDIHCGHCKSSIEGALADLGVSRAEVDIDQSTVDVGFDPTAVSLDAIVEAIEGQGYIVDDRT